MAVHVFDTLLIARWRPVSMSQDLASRVLVCAWLDTDLVSEGRGLEKDAIVTLVSGTT